MEITTSKKVIDMMFIISWYIGLSIFAVSLILLRDDADLLYNDIKESFNDGLFYGCCFILAFVFYSPMTLPYSINYFIQKWK